MSTPSVQLKRFINGIEAGTLEMMVQMMRFIFGFLRDMYMDVWLSETE